jgi:hypothetical protein
MLKVRVSQQQSAAARLTRLTTNTTDISNSQVAVRQSETGTTRRRADTHTSKNETVFSLYCSSHRNSHVSLPYFAEGRRELFQLLLLDGADRHDDDDDTSVTRNQ